MTRCDQIVTMTNGDERTYTDTPILTETATGSLMLTRQRRKPMKRMNPTTHLLEEGEEITTELVALIRRDLWAEVRSELVELEDSNGAPGLPPIELGSLTPSN